MKKIFSLKNIIFIMCLGFSLFTFPKGVFAEELTGNLTGDLKYNVPGSYSTVFEDGGAGNVINAMNAAENKLFEAIAHDNKLPNPESKFDPIAQSQISSNVRIKAKVNDAIFGVKIWSKLPEVGNKTPFKIVDIIVAASKRVPIDETNYRVESNFYTFVENAPDSSYDINNWICEIEYLENGKKRCYNKNSSNYGTELWVRNLRRPQDAEHAANDPVQKLQIFKDFKESNYEYFNYFFVVETSINLGGAYTDYKVKKVVAVSTMSPIIYEVNRTNVEKWETPETLSLFDSVSGIYDFTTKKVIPYQSKYPMPTAINCSLTYTEGSFEAEYCRALNSSSVINISAKTTSEVRNSNASIKTFSCDPRKIDTPDHLNDNYYLNVNYMAAHASVVDPILKDNVPLQYVYHYNNYGVEGTGDGKKVDVTCKKDCTEAVTVEYGPPVATKAGFGFEYKVKVTSRVNCVPAGDPAPPTPPSTVCVPVPVCYHGEVGWTFPGSGPNEDFDKCVNQCDGGKYTDKCSQYCYNKVYASNSDVVKSSSTALYDDYLQKVAQFGDGCNASQDKMDEAKTNCRNVEYDTTGSYYRIMGSFATNYTEEAESRIIWKPDKNNQNTVGLARYYKIKNTPKDSLACVKNDNQGGGIASVCACQAVCLWEGCEEADSYLNVSNLLEDYKKNYETYKAAVDSCRQSSSCNTTQSEYTISTNYTLNDGKETKNVKFPYTRTSDILQFKSVDNTIGKEDSSLISSNGCYSSEIDTNWYMAEWGFPGVWMNGKTGQISYVAPDGWSANNRVNSWYFKKNKYYIPRNADYVNEKWWLYYFSTLYNNNPSYAANSNNSASNDICIQSCSYPNRSQFTDLDSQNINYNIKATARAFGFFNWNIDINCFYANGDIYNYSDEECKSNCKSYKNSSDYKVRSVDLKNFFPDSTGSGKASESDRTSDPIPFNWSSFATNDKAKDYLSNPAAYLKWMEENNYSIYSDEYLDYEIVLDRRTIRELRNSSYTFGSYDKGRIIEDSGVYSYRSPLFDSGGLLANASNKYPSDNALKCNNMDSRDSSSCKNF